MHHFQGVILRLCPPSVENRSLTDPAEIEQALHFGEYMKNGTHVHTSCVTLRLENINLHHIAWSHGDRL